MVFVTTICNLYSDRQDEDLHENMRLDYRIELIKELIACEITIVVFAQNSLISSLGNVPERVHVIPFEPSDLDLYSKIMAAQDQLTLPTRRSAMKDRLEYLALMASKSEMVQRAKAAFPGQPHYFWIDGGIFKILSDRQKARELIEQIPSLSLSHNKIIMPRGSAPCAERSSPIVLDEVQWRFLGTLYNTPASLVDRFMADNERLIDALLLIGQMTWEINLWARLEAVEPDLFDTYPADHNMRILDIASVAEHQ